MNKRTSTALALLALVACGDDAVSPEGGTTSGSSGAPPTTSTMTGVDPTPGDGTTTTANTTEVVDESSGTTESDETTGGPAVCGDGVLGGRELCDDGNTDADDGCSEACEVEEGYACDDEEPSLCATVCGDGLIRDGEVCDDGNTDADDGCDDACELEGGFFCDDAEPTVCESDCGDGMVVGMEQCDDGGNETGDGCDDACVVEKGWACDMEPSVCDTGCGDGIVAGMEVCDDGDFEAGDGCSARCTPEDGWLCDDASPTACIEDCGDSLIVGTEECDDGGAEPDDGCDATCAVEPGFVCEGLPSVCVSMCGDGAVAASELCDDGNIAQGDGCDATCVPEFPFACDASSPSVCTVAETLADVALGSEGGCVLTASGTVACFGNNSESQVGNGTDEVETFLPVPVFADAQQVSAGDEHICALTITGEVWCWGDNSSSQIGPGGVAGTDVPTPLQVTGLPAGVAVVESGDDHSCVLDSAGAVLCWGDNDNRQLGQGGTSIVDAADPAVVELGQAAVDLGLGENHSCAVLADATVACWGDDDGGQLGDGTAGTDSGVPTVVTGLTGVVDVEGGRDTTCALDDAGDVWCWGNNGDGEVGIGTTDDVATPQAVPLAAAAEAISLGDNFSCAMLTNDEVYCWGEGSDFQLGSGNLLDEPNPVQVLGMPDADLVDIEAGARGVCVMLASDERWCWGYSEEGQLGIAPLNQLDLAPALTFSGPLASLHLAQAEYRGNVCGVLVDGTVECAGDGTTVSSSSTTGAAGIFNGISRHLSELTPNPGLVDAQTVALGSSSICFGTSTNVQCFGDNSQLQMGQGDTSTVDLAAPAAVVTLGAVDELEAGRQFYCARQSGDVRCWGDNSGLQTGQDATTADQSTPVTVAGLDDALDIELGEDHGCALRTGGVVSCWGEDGGGQLGDNDGDPGDSATAVDVTGLPGAVSQVVVGQDHSCALVGTDVYCWGDGGRGQLGQGDTEDSDTALLVPGLPPIVNIASGYNYICAIDDAAQMWCWGYGLDGQLGDGGVELSGLTDVLSPVAFGVASGITDVVAGNSLTCVETAAGWQCLGFRSSGQLADGSSLEPAVPHPMLFGI